MGKDPNKARGHGKMADLKKTPEKPLELTKKGRQWGKLPA